MNTERNQTERKKRKAAKRAAKELERKAAEEAQQNAFNSALIAKTQEITEGRKPASEVILARKTEVKTLLEAGISWRRLAYLMQLPETSCRRAVLDIPELAEAKRPEGYAAELALAEGYQRLKAAGYPAGELRQWISARASYDNGRAKNAMYRQQAKQLEEKEIRRTVEAVTENLVGDSPEQTARRKFESMLFSIDDFSNDTSNTEETTWKQRKILAEKTIAAAVVLDYE